MKGSVAPHDYEPQEGHKATKNVGAVVQPLRLEHSLSKGPCLENSVVLPLCCFLTIVTNHRPWSGHSGTPCNPSMWRAEARTGAQALSGLLETLSQKFIAKTQKGENLAGGLVEQVITQ